MSSNKTAAKGEPARHWINGEWIRSFKVAIDKANVERIDRLVKDASRYARIIVRGGPIGDGPLAAGAFYRPSMLETEALDVPLIQRKFSVPC